jgi:hypothetical protein
MLLHDMLNEEHDEDRKNCRSTKLPQEQRRSSHGEHGEDEVVVGSQNLEV